MNKRSRMNRTGGPVHGREIDKSGSRSVRIRLSSQMAGIAQLAERCALITRGNHGCGFKSHSQPKHPTA